MVRAIIVDDEEHNRNVLRILLKKYCPVIDIIDEAVNADEAYLKINSKQPQLVFLDIKMPEKSGFDLLKMFERIDFEIIFISAFDEYAITAFEFNALGYILKPINYLKLEKVVETATTKILLNQSNIDVFNFIKTFGDEKDVITKIQIHHNDKVVFVEMKNIISIESKFNLCELTLENNTNYYSKKSLKLFEELLEQTGSFILINKSTIININYIKTYSKGEYCTITMLNGMEYHISRRKKAEVLSKVIAI